MISSELLLPISYALSRPILAALPSAGDWRAVLLPCLLGLFCGFVGHVMQGLAEIESPDTLMRFLSVLCRLLGSASVWVAAETSAALLGSVHLSANFQLTLNGSGAKSLAGVTSPQWALPNLPPETLLGLAGVGGTTLAYIMPRIFQAHQQVRQERRRACFAVPTFFASAAREPTAQHSLRGLAAPCFAAAR